MKKSILFLLLLLYTSLEVKAQCAMCRAVLESGEDQSVAEGINDGIMFLMAVPYVLVAILGYYMYWKYGKSQKSKNTGEIL